MDHPQSKNPAFGTPLDPTWTRSDKEGIGTAASSDNPLWFTIAEGVVTEVYYPTVDLPQIRDLQYLVTDGATFFHDERRAFTHVHAPLDPDTPGTGLPPGSEMIGQVERSVVVSMTLAGRPRPPDPPIGWGLSDPIGDDPGRCGVSASTC